MGSDIRPVAPFEHEVFDDTIPASTDLSANQFLFHVIDANGELAIPSAGDIAFALQNEPSEQGDGGAIRILGITEYIAGGSVTAGDFVSTDAAGKGVTSLTTNRILGIALGDLATDERGSLLIVYAGRLA
jgi:hypothetical protein